MDYVATTVWQDYQRGLQYQSAKGYTADFPKFVRFYEGDQWPPVTERTRNLPRITVNVTRMICRNKAAGILGTPVRIIYKGEHDDADVKRFNAFSAYIQKELGQEELDKTAIHDGVVKGSYVYHYYWDSEAKGRDGTRQGGLRCETIDPLHVVFSNPNQRDEQKQKWIIIASREEIDSVKAKADRDADLDAIVPDEDTDDAYGTKEQEGAALVTVLTRYFRKNGEVMIEKSTKTAVINKPFALAPDIEGEMARIGAEMSEYEWIRNDENIDAPNNATPDDGDEEQGKNLTRESVRANLYPVVVGQYDFREGSIYGLGEVEGLVQAQKTINFVLSMACLNVQETAWGKYLALPGALNGQKINNTPGQVLIDYTGTGNGIKKMGEQGIQQLPVVLVDKIIQLVRSVSGATEVMSGEAVGANMSGAAIAALQSQAAAPIEELRDMWWMSKIKQGRVLAQFYKLFYENYEFTYFGEKIPGTDKDEYGQYGFPMNDGDEGTDDPKKQGHRGIFNGSVYAGREYDVAVEVTGGSKASIASDIAALDTLFGKGALDLETYISAYPDDILSNKQEILDGIKKTQQGQVAVLTQQLEQSQTQLEQAYAQIEQMQGTVDQVVSVINENRQLKALIAQIHTEATEKIDMANQTIAGQNINIKDTEEDARLFAEELNRREQTADDVNDAMFG